MMIAKLKNKRYNTRAGKAFLMAMLLVFSCLSSTYSQDKSCTKVEVKSSDKSPLEIPTNQGNISNDTTFLNKEQFIDLSIQEKAPGNIISACIFKNNSARVLNLSNGTLMLLENPAITDPVTSNELGAIRGNCILNNFGNQIFFPGLGPQDFGFDRIYSYNVDLTKTPPLSRVQKNNANDFFVPPDLPSSLQVTPNGKFLVYLQSNTSNNNIASIQSIEINNDKTFNRSIVGQDLANVVNAGNYLELAKGDVSESSKFIFGIFSNLEQGKAGSGDTFGIFRTNQFNGTNKILAEFKKNNQNFPLPEIFNTLTFSGISGLKLIQKINQLYLLVSYFETDSNTDFKDFSYITKLALFQITSKDNFSKTADLTLIGKPVLTVFRTLPCTANNFHGISGPMWISGNQIYIADSNFNQTASKGENYFASYSIDWDKVSSAKENTKVIRLSSLPIRTSKTQNERNTDIIVTPDNKFALIATSNIEEPTNAKIFTYSLKHSETNCSSLKDDLLKEGLCSLTTKAEEDDDVLIADQAPGTPQQPTGSAPPPQGGLPTIGGLAGGKPSTGGRPQEFSFGPGRPQIYGGSTSRAGGFGSPTTSSTTIASPGAPGTGETPPTDLSREREAVLPKPPKIPTSGDLKLPDLPQIELVPTETTTVTSSTSQEIDTKSIDLKGEDQIIILPRVSQITFTPTILETPEIETISTQDKVQIPAKVVKQTPPVQAPLTTIEERGVVKAGTGGFLIYLKPKVKLNSKDIKNIIYAVVDNNKKATIVSGNTTLIGTTKLLVQLSFPQKVNRGTSYLVTLLNKGGGKKEIISKAQVKIFDSYDFVNAGEEKKRITLPEVNKIQGKVTGDSVKGGKLIRLTLFGKNFASRLIKIKGRSFISETFKTHTFLSFIDETDIEILRSRVLNKGTKMLVTLRFKGDDIALKAFNISTPKGLFFSPKMEIKLFGKNPIRSVILELDKEKDKKKQKN